VVGKRGFSFEHVNELGVPSARKKRKKRIRNSAVSKGGRKGAGRSRGNSWGAISSNGRFEDRKKRGSGQTEGVYVRGGGIKLQCRCRGQAKGRTRAE